MKIKAFTGPMPVPFLVLAPVCAALGIASAYLDGAELEWWNIILIIVGAVCAHVGVNAYNEYHDFRSNLDSKTVRTPFSGGSGTLQENPGLARHTVLMATCALAAIFGMGIYFAVSSSVLIVPIGLVGAAVVALYTPFIVKRPILCLVAPGVGFGPCMVIAAHIALTGEFSWTATFVSALPFFLVSNLLLLNQFPDMDADRSVGRKNLLIAAGSQPGAVVYCVFLALAYLTVILCVIFAVIPGLGLLGLLTVPLAVAACRGALRFDGSVEKLMPSLGKNVLIVLLTPALVSLGMFLGR